MKNYGIKREVYGNSCNGAKGGQGICFNMELVIKHGHNAQYAKIVVWKAWCWSMLKGRSTSMWDYPQIASAQRTTTKNSSRLRKCCIWGGWGEK